MKTISEIYNKIYKSSGEIHWDMGMVADAMKEYAKEVIDEIEKEIRHYIRIDSNYIVSADHEIFENLKDDLE